MPQNATSITRYHSLTLVTSTYEGALIHPVRSLKRLLAAGLRQGSYNPFLFISYPCLAGRVKANYQWLDAREDRSYSAAPRVRVRALRWELPILLSLANANTL